MPGRGPIILSDFRQVIYQSGMKGGGVEGIRILIHSISHAGGGGGEWGLRISSVFCLSELGKWGGLIGKQSLYEREREIR